MNTTNNLPQLPPPRKNPGRWLYAAWLGVSISPLLIQPASATTIWEKATEIMKDVYQQFFSSPPSLPSSPRPSHC